MGDISKCPLMELNGENGLTTPKIWNKGFITVIVLKFSIWMNLLFLVYPESFSSSSKLLCNHIIRILSIQYLVSVRMLTPKIRHVNSFPFFHAASCLFLAVSFFEICILLIICFQFFIFYF